MRRTTLAILVLLLAVPLQFLVAYGEEPSSKTRHPSLVNGLKQFSYPYKLIGQQRLGTAVGYYREKNCGEKYSKEFKCVVLYVVTREDTTVNIRVIGNEIQLALFFHEYDPEIGKYKFWRPVILFPLTRHRSLNGNDYWVSEIDIVGRFFVKYNTRGNNPNEVLGYENEVYYR